MIHFMWLRYNRATPLCNLAGRLLCWDWTLIDCPDCHTARHE